MQIYSLLNQWTPFLTAHLIQHEIEQVVALARKDNRLLEHLEDDLEGTAILASPVDPHDPNYGHRIFDVRFVCPTERLARYMALVDLSTEIVLKVGPTCTPCHQHH